MRDVKLTTPEQDKEISWASRKIGADVTHNLSRHECLDTGDYKPTQDGAIAGARVAIKTLIECGVDIPEELLKSNEFVRNIEQLARLDAEAALDKLHLQSF